MLTCSQTSYQMESNSKQWLMLGRSPLTTSSLSWLLTCRLMYVHSYFLDIPTVSGEKWYREYMQASKSPTNQHSAPVIRNLLLVQSLHNTSGASDADCVSHYRASDEEWKCIFAPVSSKTFKTRLIFDVCFAVHISIHQESNVCAEFSLRHHSAPLQPPTGLSPSQLQ